MPSDDTRGSAPAVTVSELLQKIDERTERMDKSLAVLTSQRLDERVDALEKRALREEGRDNLIKGVLGASVLGALIGLLNLVDLIQHAATPR